MRFVLQRVSGAQVISDGVLTGQIKKGLVILVGIEQADTIEDINWLVNKAIKMRIFDDKEGNMNNSLFDVNGQVLLISQFTLHASTKKGNRPSFIKAARPDYAKKLYNEVTQTFSNLLPTPIQTGIFGADMKVTLTNDGPVTILIDSKNRE